VWLHAYYHCYFFVLAVSHALLSTDERFSPWVSRGRACSLYIYIHTYTTYTVPAILATHVLMGALSSFPRIWVSGVNFCCSSLDDGHSRVRVLRISRHPHAHMLLFAPLCFVYAFPLQSSTFYFTTSRLPFLLFEFVMSLFSRTRERRVSGFDHAPRRNRSSR